jgi:hypothetical protein
MIFTIINLSDWISIYPQISTIASFILFVIIVYKVIKFDKKSVGEWESMPLNDSD